MNKRLGIAVLALVLCMSLLMTACGGNAPAQENATTGDQVEYKVSVVDANGNPYGSGVIVRFMKGTEQVAMQVVDDTGTVVKALDKGEYTVELMFTDSNVEYTYDKSNLTLNADNAAVQISLAYGLTGEGVEFYGSGETEIGYPVEVGCTQVPLTVGDRNYFLFTPKEAGTYEISAIGEVSGFGCYGGSLVYVQENSIYPVENNTFSTSIRADMISEGGSNVLVIGIDSNEAESCILSVVRTGDPAWSPEDVPYEIYKPTANLQQYTLPAGATLLEFDLTADTDAYTLVLAEDGTYHLNTADGPQVLVQLGKDNKYCACLKTIATKTGIRKYFYDEEGNFLRREDYSDCLAQYTGKTDPNFNVIYEGVMDQEAGVYPLTEDLKYIIQNYGDHNGWYDLDSATSLFRDADGMPLPGINEEIAWLFMCVYIAK